MNDGREPRPVAIVLCKVGISAKGLVLLIPKMQKQPAISFRADLVETVFR
jgi:hypothetical protein